MAERVGEGLPQSHDLRFAPRRPRRRGATFLLLPLFAGLCVGGAWLHARLTGAPVWAVRSVVVSGNRSIEMTDLLDRLGLAPGMPWWSVRSRASALLATEPRLASVEVRWQWPRDLRVRVRERQSFLRVLSDPPLEIGTDGVLFTSDEELDPLDLPILTGALPPTLAPRQRLRLGAAEEGWREFLDLHHRSPEIWKRISEIHYAGGRDFRVYLREGRRVLLWETGINGSLKRSLPEVLADLERNARDDVVVDLRFRDQIVLRLPEASAADSSRRAAAPGHGHPAVERSGRRAPAAAAEGRRRA